MFTTQYTVLYSAERPPGEQFSVLTTHGALGSVETCAGKPSLFYLVHDDDLLRPDDGAESVGHDEAGPGLAGRLYRTLDCPGGANDGFVGFVGFLEL